MQSKLPQAGTRSITLLATIYQPLSVAATIYHPLRLGAVFANTCNRNSIEEWLSCCILCILYAACIYTEEQRGCIQELSRIRCPIIFEDPVILWSVGFFLKSTMSPTSPPPPTSVFSSGLHCSTTTWSWNCSIVYLQNFQVCPCLFYCAVSPHVLL